MKLPPLVALRAFESAARHSSFSKAGDELNVTHAAISHQIKHLEEWLGRPLFRREGRGIKLTKAGHQLSAVATEAFTNISEKALSLHRSKAEETIVVGSLASITSRWLVPALPEFSKQQPTVTVQIFYVHTAEYLKDEGYDVLIGLEEDPAVDVQSVKLFSRRSLPVVSPHYLERHGPFDTPEAIMNADLLHDETRDDWRSWFTLSELPDDSASRGPIFEDFNMLATAVMAGQGVALCPVDVFRNEIAKGDLIVLSDTSILDDKYYYLLMPSSPSNAVQAFCDWFTGVCSQTKDA